MEKARRISAAKPAPRPMIRPTMGGPTLPVCDVSVDVRANHDIPNGAAVPIIDRRPGLKTFAKDHYLVGQSVY